MSNLERFLNGSTLNRSNLSAEDTNVNSKALNNLGTGLTPTLTWNLFNRSFPDWARRAKQFATFFWAPRQVVGAGVKNIQWGIKGTETYIEYKVGDLIQLKIKDRGKVFESIVPSSNQIRIQCSLDYPANFMVDKVIDYGDYVELRRGYDEILAQSVGYTIYEMFRWFFISSAFGACMPTDEFNKLLLKTLALPDEQVLPLRQAVIQKQVEAEPEGSIYSPLTKFMLAHRDSFVTLANEMNKKITNIWVFDTADIVHSRAGTRFTPFKPWNPRNKQNADAIKRLKNCLVPNPLLIDGSAMDGSDLPNGQGPRLSREQSLKAFEIVLADILERTEDATYLWWQGNSGNITGKNVEDSWNDSNWPVESGRSSKEKQGSKITSEPMSRRPKLFVECTKENRILVMAKSDYRDFINGAYQGYFGEQSMATLNFDRVKNLCSEIIPVEDMPAGHAIILDKRMICCIPHLDASGQDSIMQRLVLVDNIHKWLIFGLFDQYVGVRIQMVNFTASPIDMNNVFLLSNDLQLMVPSR